jgi:hypothetical protein
VLGKARPTRLSEWKSLSKWLKPLKKRTIVNTLLSDAARRACIRWYYRRLFELKRVPIQRSNAIGLENRVRS